MEKEEENYLDKLKDEKLEQKSEAESEESEAESEESENSSMEDEISNNKSVDFNAKDNKEKPEEKDLADYIIYAFTRRPRVNFIDSDADGDALVSYQESEARLINLGILTATVLVTVSTILLIQALFQDQYRIIVHQPVPQIEPGHFPVPRILIMNPEDGQMKFFGLDKGLQFQEYWNLQVPQSLTYFPFYHFKYLYVIYSNTRKDITYIDINQKSHRVIQNSGITLNFSISSESSGTALARLHLWWEKK